MLKSQVITRYSSFLDTFDKRFCTKKFHEKNWQKEILRTNISGLSAQLMKERTIHQLLRNGSIPKSRIQVIKNGNNHTGIGNLTSHRKYHLNNDFVGVERIQKLVDGGYSIKIFDAFEYGKGLNKFISHLSKKFKCKISNNLYFTPKNSACLNDHIDPYDIFVVQISGEKIWKVKNSRTNKYETFTLKENDVLYLPRVSHHCYTENSDSLHLTFGLHPYNLNDLLSDALISVEESGFATSLPLLSNSGTVGLDNDQTNQILMLVVSHLKNSLKKVSHEEY